MKHIDLSHLLNEQMTVYPDTLHPKFEVISFVGKDGYAELKMTMVLHPGTHIDAPGVGMDGKFCTSLLISDHAGIDDHPYRNRVLYTMIITLQ